MSLLESLPAGLVIAAAAYAISRGTPPHRLIPLPLRVNRKARR